MILCRNPTPTLTICADAENHDTCTKYLSRAAIARIKSRTSAGDFVSREEARQPALMAPSAKMAHYSTVSILARSLKPTVLT